jgi:hypothetical protein
LIDEQQCCSVLRWVCRTGRQIIRKPLWKFRQDPGDVGGTQLAKWRGPVQLECECQERIIAGLRRGESQHSPVLAVFDRSRSKARQQTGTYQRRLARSGRADNRQEALRIFA